MALSAMCFSIPSFNLCHTLLLALVSVIAFTCSSCALLIYWAPCPIVFAGSLSFSPLLSLSLSLPVDVAEYVFCLPVWLVLCPCLVICSSCLAPCSSILAVLAFCFFYIYLVCSSLYLLFWYLFVVLWFSCVGEISNFFITFLLVVFLPFWSPCLYWTPYVSVEPVLVSVS